MTRWSCAVPAAIHRHGHRSRSRLPAYAPASEAVCAGVNPVSTWADTIADCPHNSGGHCHWRAARFPWSLACWLSSAPGQRPYKTIRAQGGISSPVRRGGPARNIATALRNGVNEPFVAQHSDRPPRRGPGNLERLDELALGRYARIRRVLTGLDATPQNIRDLPVRRKRGNRINPVISHIDKSNCL